MVAPKGSRIHLAFDAPSSPPSGSGLVLNFSDQQPPLGYVGAGYQGAAGVPSLRFRFREIKPRSIGDLARIGVPGFEKEAQRITAKGWDSGAISAPKYVSWRRFITPAGIAGPRAPEMPKLRLAGGYQPAPGSNIILNFAEALNPPPGSSVVLEFGAMGYGRVLGATVGDSMRFGAPQVARPESLRPAGIAPPAMGLPSLELGNRTVYTQGIAHGAGFYGKPNLTLHAAVVKPQPFVATVFGTTSIWNWRQYRNIQGFSSQAFGTPAMMGGVKEVKPGSFDNLAFGALKVINTTADQTVYPGGIAPPPMGWVNVSPRIVYPVGILGTGIGVALVQRNPSPKGWDSAVYGTPLVYFKSRFIRPGGIEAPEAGFPRVGDWARRILHVASPVTSVFGDTTLRLKNHRVYVPGINTLEMSDWAELRNRNRGLQVPGIAPGEAGSPSIRNKTPSFAPHGFDASVFGVADVGYQVRAVRPVGVLPPAPAFGLPSFWQTPALKPLGIAPPAVPVPALQNARRYIDGVGGTAMARYGTPMVGYRYRHIAPGGVAVSGYGQPRLEHRDRTLLAQSFALTAYGNPLLTLARRFLSPVGIKPVDDGANHMVGGTRWLRPLGFEATRWGTRIIPEAQVLYPLGFGGAFGWPKLENKHQYIKPDSIRLYKEPQQYFGRGEVFNSRQFITMFYDVDSELNPPRWPQWTLIENRNKRMGVSGWDASKVAAPRIENTARVLLPAGMPAPALPEYQKTGMVAFRIRPLYLDGLEPPYISSWANFRNAARLLKPAGLVATEFGTAKLENRSREFNRIGGWDSAWFGYPFVAPRIRELSFEARYTIAPPIVPVPRLQLHTRYIEPKGIAPKEVGAAALDIRFNRITPRWTMINYWGYPTVHNVTPELRQRGRATDEWGDTHVRLQWRPVAPDGTNMAQIGKPIIADSRRTVTVAGTNMLRIGDKLTVTKTGVPPLALQYIWLDATEIDGEKKGGHGIPTPGWPEWQVGVPSMQQQVIYPRGIPHETLFGTPKITANSIRVEPGIFDLTVGEPMVSLRRRSIAPKSIERKVEYGKPRLSPHTIYAVTEAPEQARLNHPSSNLHLVNSWTVFGSPAVQNRHRVLAQVNDWSSNYGSMLAFGRAELHNARQYLYPEGRLMSRMGWPSLPGDTLIEFYTTISTMAMGAPTVSRPPYVGPRTVAPNGYVATLFGTDRVEHFNRTLLAKGHDSMAMGTRKADDKPYMWQGLRVGPLLPTIPNGFNAELFGKTWISHRVRELAPEGFDAFRSEYDYQAFAQRMRVRNATKNERLPQIVKAQGQLHSSLGTPGVRLGVHYIRPDGNSDQYRKGVPA